MSAPRERPPLGVRLVFVLLGIVVRGAMNLLIAKQWEGAHHIPRGGCILCPNHLTEIDPLVIGHFVYSQGCIPYFLAKESLFRIPILGKVITWAGQIPVDRSGAAGVRSLTAARRVLARGGVIIIYPEGTLTRDPALWPMQGRTGAARLALETGAPVLPVAHWGVHELLPPYARRLRVFPRKVARIVVGPPLDLSAFRDAPLDRATLDAVTNRIQDSTTALLAGLRGEPAPATRFVHHRTRDPR